METTSSGFREIEHTADWELHIWAQDMPGLLEQSARGMYALMGARSAEGERIAREFELPFWDRESLLVDFLSELLFLTLEEKVLFDEYHLTLDENRLRARVVGLPLASLTKEIKAVTFHNLKVRETARGLEANVVFDV
ncbi:MAG: archease [Anaerolineae bacterium]|nr:MAG: archease [Anaerolineae bacterium]